MAERIRIGVLGGRSWIANAAVLPAIAECAVAQVGSVGSRSGSVSYADVLADPSIDAVYIALPNQMHLEWVQRSAEAGKHVLCEKPLACNVAEVEAMAAACHAAGVVLAEAYMTPFHPRSVAIARRIAAGDIGEVCHIDTQFSFTLADAPNYRWQPEHGGGALLDVGVYCLAPLVQALGPDSVVVGARQRVAATGIDTTTSAMIAWPQGATASVLMSFELPERQWMHLAGTNGSLAVERPFTPGPNDAEFVITRPDGTIERHGADGGNCYLGMIEAFADAVRARAPWPRAIGDVIDVVSLSDKIRTAAGSAR
ncbi:unannotated protein [freshwater metagenome]|uniref:Unannotated protein n=1 Tax=freshwater metagenome TaxID=449393 RepID=A0A6J7F9Y5_9ZZZZ